MRFRLYVLITCLAFLRTTVLFSQQDPPTICVDVSFNLNTFKDADPNGDYKYFTKGNCFFIYGIVYPEGTFDTHGVTSGIENESAAFPEEVLGRIISRGWVVQDIDSAFEGRLAMTKHILMMDKSYNGLDPFQLMTTGDEPAALNTPMLRAISGGTDTMMTMKGEETMQYVGINASGARNYTLCYTLDNILDQVLPISEKPSVFPNNLTMHLYPNPNHGTFALDIKTLYSNGPALLRLYDMRGSLIMENDIWLESGENHISQTFENLPTGMYYLLLNHGKSQEESRLFISQ